MKLREKDIITLRVEGTGYAAKTDEKVRRPPWRAPRPRKAPRRAPEPRAEQALTLRPRPPLPHPQALVVSSESRPVARF